MKIDVAVRKLFDQLRGPGLHAVMDQRRDGRLVLVVLMDEHHILPGIPREFGGYPVVVEYGPGFVAEAAGRPV